MENIAHVSLGENTSKKQALDFSANNSKPSRMCTLKHMYTHTCSHMHTHTYTHTCTHIHVMSTCTHTYVHTQMHVHIRTHTYTHLYINTYTHCNWRERATCHLEETLCQPVFIVILYHICTQYKFSIHEYDAAFAKYRYRGQNRVLPT